VLRVVVLVRQMVRRMLRAAVLGYCVVVLLRHVLQAAISGWCMMSAAVLRDSDGALFAYESLVVGLSVRGFLAGT